MSDIPKNLKKFRKESQMTQQELAEHLNVTRQAVSNWETGVSITRHFGYTVAGGNCVQRYK